MEWMNRGGQPGQPAASQQPSAHGAPTTHAVAGRQSKFTNSSGPLRWLFLALLFTGVILAVAAIVYSAVGGSANNKTEDSYVDNKQMQAVFLNGGQVYFGKINNLNNKFLRMSDIYYLRVNQQVQPNQSSSQAAGANDISLVKLGCELHGPEDSMVINREQIIFWENLKSDGQVAQAVEKYIKDNPDGQKCNQQTETPAATTPATTTPSTTKKQ